MNLLNEGWNTIVNVTEVLFVLFGTTTIIIGLVWIVAKLCEK